MTNQPDFIFWFWISIIVAGVGVFYLVICGIVHAIEVLFEKGDSVKKPRPRWKWRKN
jgi:hypothetical protein